MLEQVGARLLRETVGGPRNHAWSVSRFHPTNTHPAVQPGAIRCRWLREMVEDIRVLVVDEGPGLAKGLMLALPRRGPITILGPVADADEALEALRDGRVDVVLVDIDRADGRGVEVVGAIRDGAEHAHVLAATAQSGPEMTTIALAAGACGVLPPERDRSLVSVFRRALAGELVLPAEDLPRLVDRLRRSGTDISEPERLATLTAREREILLAFADGRSTTDVAKALSISPLTVQSHAKNVLAKLGVHTKVEAVRMAWRHGFGSVSRTA
jgi:DNA-binding NarL/FixJ family response regulator